MYSPGYKPVVSLNLWVILVINPTFGLFTHTVTDTYIFKNLVYAYRMIVTVFGLGGWTILIIKAISAILMAILSLQLYTGIVTV